MLSNVALLEEADKLLLFSESAGPAASPRALLLDRLLDGATMKDAVREVSALPGQSRNAVYRASLEVADFLRRAGDEA